METTIEEKLNSLNALQAIDSKIDALKSTRGELPIEVQDLEDELAGLETRIERYKEEIANFDTEIANAKNKAKENQQLAKKYQTQLTNVKNNREFDALNKETELLDLENQAIDKRVRDWTKLIDQKKETIATISTELEGRNIDLKNKKGELNSIIEETEEEEKALLKKREKALKVIDARLLAAYDRIRNSVKNGIAVASVERSSCSGCFGTIPLQMQSEIRQHKKILICEHCGRILSSVEEIVVAEA